MQTKKCDKPQLAGAHIQNLGKELNLQQRNYIYILKIYLELQTIYIKGR